MTIVLGVRHATVENPHNVVYARLPGFGLSSEGRAAAERTGDALASAPVRAVYASPRERARETAAALAAAHGLEVIVDERLIEWSFWSRWEGFEWERVRDDDPETFRIYAEDPGSLHPEDPLQAAGERVVSWAEEAAFEHGDGVVIGVSHEAPLAAAYLAGRGESMRGFPALHIPHLQGVRLLPPPPELTDPRAVVQKP